MSTCRLSDVDGSVGSGTCPCRCHFPLSCCGRRKINCKMLTRQVLIVCLIKCLLIAIIVPLSLQSDYDYSNPVGHAHNYGEEDNNVQPEPQPSSSEGPEGHSIGGSAPTTNDVELNDDGQPSAPDPNDDAGTDSDATANGGAAEENADPEIIVVQHIDEPDAATESPDETETGTESDTENDTETGGADETESETESSTTDDDDDDDATEAPADADADTDTSDDNDGASCSHSSNGNNDNGELKESLTQVTEKIEQLFTFISTMNGGMERMETLIQSTIVDERLYKCIGAINNANQSQALKYWKQILRYQTNNGKKSSILKQIIKDSYLGKEENILNIIQFIDSTKEYYGYETLFRELETFDKVYHHRTIFTLAHYIIKGCGRSSELFKLMPAAVQTVNAKFFTLQNKFNKGYLYYAKRCVATHYYHCLDVLTKRIESGELEYLDPEEKKRYQWNLNATDDTVSKFFILYKGKYWPYRLLDVHNSPRFRMEETGKFHTDLAHFQLELNTDDEIAIQIRETNIYLEGEEFRLENTSEVLLHSFQKSDTMSNPDRILWLVQSVNDEITDEELADNENCKVVSNGNNGNGVNNGNGAR